MSTMTGGDLNLVKPELTDDHKVTIGTDLPSNFQKIDDAFTARRVSNRNILHNWDFQIWQRGDSIPLVSTGISADRWRVWQDGFQASKQVDVDGRPYIRIVNISGVTRNLYLYQTPENYTMLNGEILTSSVRIRGYNGFSGAFYMRHGSTGNTDVNLTNDWKDVPCTGVFVPTTTYSLGYLLYGASSNLIPNGQGIEIKATKLELGSISTLANDPPGDFGEQLLLCKRFYRLWTTEAARTAALAEVGLMRLASPTLSTIVIGGTTYYAASADL